MPRIAYITKNFNSSTLYIIGKAVSIIEEYEADGYSLTLRQLYYQFVARDLIKNNQKEYNRLGRIISEARLAGYIDWKSIEDRTRSLTSWRHYDDPADAIERLSRTYEIDMWENQEYYVEVWVEKDALAGVLNKVCGRLDLPYFSCRGYTSSTEIWKASQRLGEKNFLYEKKVVVLHLGDHDPSGIDMTRDIELRLNEYAVTPEYRHYELENIWTDPDYINHVKNHDHGWPIEVKRIALNMDQIEELNPPPNFAKVTDSRYDFYREKYGSNSWELDALEPSYISDLITNEVNAVLNQEQWDEDRERNEKDVEIMTKISDHYDDVKDFVESIDDD